MMKENSPICARPMPTQSEVRRSRPPTKTPKLQVMHLAHDDQQRKDEDRPRIIARAFSGSISMPMVTKKMALNMSRTGAVSSSILWICRDSAITAPMRNAPSATE